MSSPCLDSLGIEWFPFIHFSIAGKPVPWARHKGIGPAAKTPERQKTFKKTITQYGWQKTLELPPSRRVLEGVEFRQASRIYVPLTADMQKRYDSGKPADMPNHARELIDLDKLFCIDRPDLDNWIKLPMDALNNIVWKDDGQVVSFDGSGKWFSHKPRLDVTIYTLEDRRK